MSEKTSSKRTIWQLLVEPRSNITGRERYRRVRVSSGLTLTLLVVSLLLTGLGLIFYPDITELRPAMPTLGLLLITYLLTRTRWPEAGSGLLVFGWAAMTFVIFSFYPDPDVITWSMMFVLVPILLSMLIMPAWVTAVLAALSIIALTIFSLLAPWMEFGTSTIFMPFAVTTALAVLAGAAGFLRERDVKTIRQQTVDLDRHSQTLEAEVDQRTRRIMATAEIGRAITGTRDLNTLLKQVVNMIVDNFDFYHAQVFMIDEAGKQAVLAESTGVAGQELLARGHRLAVGSRSVIGQVTSQGDTIIASDTDVDAVHRRNELLPHTRSEMALPLRVSGRIIGALDVQSVNPDAFSEEDVPVLQTMADQLAIAIENVRLFERAQSDLQDIELLNRQITGQAWGRFMDERVAPLGYKSGEYGIRPIGPGEEDDGARQTGDTISLPLTVRGETIGSLDLSPRGSETPDEDTQQMLEAVAERVALALDSARLGEQSRTQAEREQILSRISAELQATTDLDAILRITAREISRALGAPRGFVYLTAGYGADTQAE